MNREQLYNIYQTNLELLENELVQVKRMVFVISQNVHDMIILASKD